MNISTNEIRYVNGQDTHNLSYEYPLLVIIAGSTNSVDFPLKNAFQTELSGESDIFLAKFSPDGQSLLFSTFLGGSERDYFTQIALDPSGNIILSGETDSADFPLKNSQNKNFGNNRDVFVTKISADGQSVLFSLPIGGSGSDGFNRMIADEIGNIYVLGETTSTDLPLIKPFKENLSAPFGTDHFITILSDDGKTIFLSSYIGVNRLPSMKLDNENNLYIYRSTSNIEFPLVNAYDPVFNGGTNDAFIMKILSNDRTLAFSTFLGGESSEKITDIAIDYDGNIFMVGRTYSNDFPLINEFDSELGGEEEGFITKLSSDGQSILFSTLFGGSDYDIIDFIEIEETGDLTISGTTSSTDFPYQIDDQTTVNSSDIYFSRISSEGQLLSGSRFGGSNHEDLHQMVRDYQGSLYLSGKTKSSDFPLVNEFDAIYGGNETNDAFLVKISPDDQSLIFSTYFGGSAEDGVSKMIIDDYGNVFLVGSTKSHDFPVKNAYNSSFGGIWDGFLAKFSIDFDYDGMTNLWEQNYGLNPNINDADLDFDSDGIPNLYEFQMGLIPNVNDANVDSDDDGMPNLWEFQMGLQANINDASEDLDNDGIPNLWEYQNNLLANTSDSRSDKDGDWVTNINEYHTNTQANDFWSFPLLYPEFPFILSLPALFFVSVISLGTTGGVIGAISLRKYQKRLFMKKMGVNDYETALKMKKGGFHDYKTFKKAQEQNIDSLEEYEFANELQKTTNESEED
jgi:hypothetical protein